MSIKKILPVLLIVLLAAAWYSNLSSIINAPLNYKSNLKQAKKYEDEERFQYAIEEYEKAISYKPENKELYEREADAYENLGDEENMIKSLDYIIANFDDNEEAYLRELKYYETQDISEEVAAKVVQAYSEHPDNKEIQKYYKKFKGTYYELYTKYKYISRIRSGGAIVINEQGNYGMITPSGETRVTAKYESLTLFSRNENAKEQLAAVKLDDELYYMDEKGYKALVNDKDYDFLGEISEGVMAAGINGKYGYALWDYENRSFNAATDFEWDYAGTMFSNTAAVCKDGKWALINSELKEITKYQYEEIVTDEFGFCSINNVVFVKEDGKYKMIDLEGNDIGNEKFDSVKPFVGGEYAAVMKDGKWGFVDNKGEIKIKCEYDDADSFSMQYAPVMKDGKWGYIDKQNELVFDYQFDGAKQFTDDGIAPVYINNVWCLICAYIY